MVQAEGGGRVEPVDLLSDKDAERPPERARLLAPARVQGNVPLPLQAVLGVVGGFAVADEDKAMRKRGQGGSS